MRFLMDVDCGGINSRRKYCHEHLSVDRYLENDITKSIAWALCNCPVFMKQIIKELLGIETDPEKVSIRYQEYEKDKGITDLELTDDEQFYIIMAGTFKEME